MTSRATRIANTAKSLVAVWTGLFVVFGLVGFSRSCNAAESITRLTRDGRSYSPFPGGWSPDGKHILFAKEFPKTAEGARPQQLWIMNPDGSGAEAISRVGWQNHYGWSPDGKLIAFAYAERREMAARADIYIYNVDSGTSKQLASGYQWSQFARWGGWATLEWTKDSKQFSTLMTRTSELSDRADAYMFDVDTGKSTGLTPNNYTTGGYYPLKWSPDGSKMTMMSKSSANAVHQVWVCNRDGSDLRPITPKDWQVWGSDPVWSPDGQWIAFTTAYGRPEEEKDAGMADLWLVRPDGKDAHAVTHGHNDDSKKRMHFLWPEWTPDGKYIFIGGFRRDPVTGDNEGLYLFEVATGNLITIIENDPESDQFLTDFHEVNTLSPDGTKVALTAAQYTVRGRRTDTPSYEDERDILYYFDIPTLKLHEVKRTRPKEDGVALSGGGYSWKLHWSADGKRLLFVQAKVISVTEGKFEPDLYVLSFDQDQAGAPDQAAPAGAAAEPKTVEEPAKSAPLATPAEQTPAPEPATTYVPGALVVLSPKHRRASQIANGLPQAYADIFKVDQELNALVVSAPDEAVLLAFKRDVDLLDRPAPRIMVDVLVAELTRDASKELGLDWEFAKGRLGGKLPLLDGGLAGDIIYQGVGKLDRNFFVALSALEEEGKAIVKANPRVLATGGTEAMINIRRTDNFLFESGTDNLGRPMRSRSDISADTILKIMPQLLDSGRIAMRVDATVDNFVFGEKNDLPDTTRRQATTDVVVGDGETIIIGGLTLEESSQTTRKTPVLGNLPLIGGLFRKTNRSKKETTLVMFLSPHVVREGENKTTSKWGIDADVKVEGVQGKAIPPRVVK